MDESKLFSNVSFFIAQCANPDELRNLLIDGGARHINYLSEHVTHVISDYNCPDAEEAVELFDKPVVSSLWVRLSIKAGKILPPAAFSLRKFFQDVVASFSKDLSQNDINSLAAAITYYGGRVTRDLSSSTHFIVASSKPIEFQDKTIPHGNFKMVSPDWISESEKQKSCCDETLFEPSLLLSPPPSPPPKQPTPPLQTKQQQPMIETKEHNSSLESDNQDRNQINQPKPSQSNMEPARKIDFSSQTRTQNPSQFPQQSQQINTMQTLPPMTRVPRMSQNIIRGASPRFRSISPQTGPGQQAQLSPRVMMPEQGLRKSSVDYNHSYRKAGPYPINADIQQQQQLQQPLPQHSQPYQQVEHPQMHQQGTMNSQQVRIAQPNLYQQVRPTYQNSHVQSRMPTAQQSALNSKQMQIPVQRFQDASSQMPRPYQMNVSQQTVNPNYQQCTGVQRQPIYYNQDQNNLQMRMPQQVPMTRGLVMSGDQVIGDPHHRYQNQQQPQQAIYQQHQQMQQASSQQIQKPHPFPQPQKPTPVPNHPQLQPNMPNAHGPRGPRKVTNYQLNPEIKSTGTRLSNSQNNDKANREHKTSAPHPSIFDMKQESNYAQMKAKVPILTDSTEYHNYASDHIVPKGKPFYGCKFKLIEHDDVSARVRQNWCDAIIEAGGVFDESIEKLTHLICESQSSPLFTSAVKSGVRCVTIYWINDVLSQDRLEYPWKALHIPTCYKKDDRHLQDQIISITNLRGKDKREVREMIKKTGAKYTDYFSKRNTLLICGSPGGEKFERAIEWGIPIANCLLMSDYLIGGRRFTQMLDHAKYQNFNRGDQLKLDSYDLIKDLMIPWTKPFPTSTEKSDLSNGTSEGPSSANINDDSGLATGSSSNSEADASKLNTVPESRSEAVSCNIVERVESVQKKDLDDDEKKFQEENSIIVDPSLTGNNSNVSTGDILSKDESSLSSELISKSQTEKGREKDETNLGNNCSGLQSKDQRTRKVRVSTAPVRILFTRLNPKLVPQLETYAHELGLELASSWVDCTHLITDRISRSPKFIMAFSYADFILSYKWLVDSHESGKTLDEFGYILQDDEGEKLFSFNLVHSLLNRKKRNSLLFKDFIFFVTPTLKTRISSIIEMIESAGGAATSKKLPTRAQISQIRADGKRFVVAADIQDQHLLYPVEGLGVEIVSPEFVLSGILRQEVDFVTHRLKCSAMNGFQSEPTASVIQPSPQKKLRHS